ncbi:MAG TPA: hypothetical protein VNC41_11865 [Acidimicrobiia bacterium]|nr:hypothetical protein [Acidimicrobiia bacterium]
MTLHMDESAIANESPVIAGSLCLCRFDDGEVFAYVERGTEYIRASDHELWATEREDTLMSVRSGAPLAVKRGKVWFSVDADEPLYYERAI